MGVSGQDDQPSAIPAVNPQVRCCEVLHENKTPAALTPECRTLERDTPMWGGPVPAPHEEHPADIAADMGGWGPWPSGDGRASSGDFVLWRMFLLAPGAGAYAERRRGS